MTLTEVMLHKPWMLSFTSPRTQRCHVSVLTPKPLFSWKCFQIQLNIERSVKEFTSSHAKGSTWNKLGRSSAWRKD